MTAHKYQITVAPRATYIAEQSDADADRYAFAYTITITNTGEVPAQLLSRHWIITDGDHKVQEVKGLGVVGQQPLLKPGESFEYTSGASIPTAVGTMQGSYQMMAEDASEIRVWQLGARVALAKPELLEFACDWTGEAVNAMDSARRKRSMCHLRSKTVSKKSLRIAQTPNIFQCPIGRSRTWLKKRMSWSMTLNTRTKNTRKRSAGGIRRHLRVPLLPKRSGLSA